MNSKTLLTAVIGAVAGLGLAMGAMVFAQNTGHMGSVQTTQQATPNQNTHGNMHGKTVYGGNTHSPGQGMMGQARQQNTHGNMHQQSANNTPCHADTPAKSGAKT